MKYYNAEDARPLVKKYFIIAGEASGDLHAANLVAALQKIQAHSEFAGFGGDRLEEKGVKVLRHYRDMDFMGFVEVLQNIRKILNNLEYCKQCILDFRPDVIILVDYPGFNLRIAPYAKALGIKVVYYISPQVWAWKQSRVYKIRKIVDRMLVILPFESEFYRQFNMEVDFVGHPLLDALEERKKADWEAFQQQHGLSHKPVIALLPGSRKQEISTKLPIMLSMVTHFPDYQFVIAAAKAHPIEFYRELAGDVPVKIISGETYNILEHARAALVTSGTATLETALLDVPQVVCYKGNPISFYIARKLVKVKFISLVNLIMDREVVRELIQDELNETTLKNELTAILDAATAHRIKADYVLLREKLGGPGASERAARIIANV